MPAPKDKAESSTNALPGVARVREARLRPARDLSMAGPMDRELREIRKLKRAVGAIAQAWNATVPQELLKRTGLQSLSRGVLTVAVPDAATRFLLDRHLRGGGERALIGQSAAAIRSVRIVISNGQSGT